MYQNVLSVVNAHQPVWNGVQSMVTAVDQLNGLLNTLQNKLNLQSTLTQGIRIEKDAYIDELTENMSILKKALFIYATETNNPSLRERHKESKSKLAALSSDRLQILCISILEDLDLYASALGTVGITPAHIQDFHDKVTNLESRRNSVRNAIRQRTVETGDIRELEKQINRLLIDRLDRFISFFKASNGSFFKNYRIARRVITNNGNTGPRPSERDDGSVH